MLVSTHRCRPASLGFALLLAGAVTLNACSDAPEPIKGDEHGSELQTIDHNASSRTGLYTYYADAARFTDCATGAALPVAPSMGALELERAWLAAGRTLEQPMLVEVVANEQRLPGMEEGTLEQQLVVEQLIRVSTDRQCPDEQH